MKKNKRKKRKLELGGFQQYQQPQQQSLVDNESDQQADALVSGTGAINPIVGGFMKLGQGIGKQTQDNNGLYKSRAGGVLDNSVNPTTGISNFKDISKDFNTSTLANQLTAGVIGRSATQTRRKKELVSKNNYEQSFIKQDLINNSGQPGMAKGGNIMSKKLKVLGGGQLNTISSDAVEVNANNPIATDSVELQNAFVDNNEIIDNKDRVFSDVIATPRGISVAKEAKRLEKMKSSSSRFNDSNTRIESKLDELFKYQETTKQDNTVGPDMNLTNMRSSTGNYNKGRIFDDDPFVELMQNSDKKADLRQLFSKSTMRKGGKLKPKLDSGGPLAGINLNEPYEDGFAESTVSKSPNNNKKLLGTLGVGALAVAPNIVSGILQKRLKGPKSPSLETSIKLDRLDPAAQLAEASRQSNMATRLVTSNTAQGSNLGSSVGSLLGKRLSATNQIYGQNQSLNAEIQGREALINSNIKARNTERTNMFKDNQVAFHNKKLQMTTENVSNLSNKALQGIRQGNQMKLDKEKYESIQQRFEDLPEEMRGKYSNIFDYYQDQNADEVKSTNKFGGYLKSKAKRKTKLNKRLGGMYC